MMISEEAETKFGQLPAADFAAYEAGGERAAGADHGRIRSPGALHGVAVQGQPASADAPPRREAALAARAQDRQSTFGARGKQVARLIVAVEQGSDPAGVDVAVKWADPTTRSVAQEADAVVKLHSVVSCPGPLRLQGSGTQMTKSNLSVLARRAEALDAAGVDVAVLLP